MAQHQPPGGESDDDFEDSRFYGNEGDGVQYATIDTMRQFDIAEENEEETVVPSPTADLSTLSPKDRKKEEKRLEKERKEKEKQEKLILKERERQIKEEAKLKKSVSLKKSSSRGKADSSKAKPGARPRNVVLCRVHLLDGSDIEFEINKNAKGQLLLEMVNENVNLLEREFFSCYFIKDDARFWLISDRKVDKQIGKLPWVFHFGVKFYAPEPSKLTEDITRYQLCLQLRLDILSGRLPCTFVTNALLGAFTVQAEYGDYDPSEHGDGIDYLNDFEFCPEQTPELLAKIAQIHRTLRGQTPADAELNFLENVKKLELYGIELQSAKDAELVNILVGVSAIGISIYRDQIRINRFPWPLVLKMAYKSDKFYLKIRPGEREQYITTIVIKMLDHDTAKRFWRLAIEHHSFFRLKQPLDLERSFFSRFGSSGHRFSGRTYFQSRVYASSAQRLAPYFERASSQQLSRSLGGSFIDERSARKKAVNDFDCNNDSSGHYEQVAVVAGSGHDANRVAFVKTVRPGDIIEEPSVDDQHNISQESANTNRRFQRSNEAAVTVHQTSYTNSSDASFSRSTTEASAIQVVKQQTVVSVVTEHKSIKNGVVETKIEKRQMIGRVDANHEEELSKAIHSAMNMSADLSVDKIEINPSDIAHSMVGNGDEQTINIVPSKTKKAKKREKHEIVTG